MGHVRGVKAPGAAPANDRWEVDGRMPSIFVPWWDSPRQVSCTISQGPSSLSPELPRSYLAVNVLFVGTFPSCLTSPLLYWYSWTLILRPASWEGTQGIRLLSNKSGRYYYHFYREKIITWASHLACLHVHKTMRLLIDWTHFSCQNLQKRHPSVFIYPHRSH